MKFKLFLIYCAFLYPISEISANSAICQYAKSDIFIFFMKNPGYKCEFALDSQTYESVTDIDGDHDRNKADGNVNILLSYSSSKIQEFSSIFCEKFTNLEAIKLENVKIKAIDNDSLQNCGSLRLLHLNNNEIRKIPENLLTENLELSEIEIGSNQLESLAPDTFEMQENLKKLFLNKNKIESLPSGIFRTLHKLERLNLDENEIEILDPEWFKDLEKLQKLSLNGNKIYDLPKGVFSSLKDLQLLEVNSNYLSAIYSDSFGIHRTLTNVHLSFNKIEAIDPNFVANSPISVVLMEDNKCFNENITRRDLVEEDLEPCFINFNEGRVPRLTTTTSTTTTRKPTTTTTKKSTTSTTITRKPTTTTTKKSTTSTTTTRTTRPTTTTEEQTTTTTEPTTTTTTEPKTTTKSQTRRPPPSITTSTTESPKVTTPRFILPKDKYGKPHPIVKAPDTSKSQFDRGAYPWIAGVLKNGDYHCGGVLVSDRKVVTAARCMFQKYRGSNKELYPRDLMVILGSHSIYEKFEMRKTTASVYRIRIHPEFDINSTNSDADVAVLVLNEIVKFIMFVRPIVLMDLNPESVTVTDGVVVSYGQQGSMKAGSNVTPRQVQSQIQDCSISSNEAGDRTFCVKSDICTEDVGSGLFIKYFDYYYLRGIASTVIGVNNGVCNENSNAVFTDISKYSKWIGDVQIEDEDKDYE